MIMRDHMTKKSSREMYCFAQMGGLGHKFRSISQSVMYAMLLDRNFYCISRLMRVISRGCTRAHGEGNPELF